MDVCWGLGCQDWQRSEIWFALCRLWIYSLCTMLIRLSHMTWFIRRWKTFSFASHSTKLQASLSSYKSGVQPLPTGLLLGLFLHHRLYNISLFSFYYQLCSSQREISRSLHAVWQEKLHFKEHTLHVVKFS